MTTTGLDLRHTGQQDILAADTAAHRGYADHVRIAVDTLIALGATFTADDVRAMIPADAPEPHHPNVLPAVLGSMRSHGLLRAVGHRQCTRPSRRAGWMRVWTGAEPLSEQPALGVVS